MEDNSCTNVNNNLFNCFIQKNIYILMGLFQFSIFYESMILYITKITSLFISLNWEGPKASTKLQLKITNLVRDTTFFFFLQEIFPVFSALCDFEVSMKFYYLFSLSF